MRRRAIEASVLFSIAACGGTPAVAPRGVVAVEMTSAAPVPPTASPTPPPAPIMSATSASSFPSSTVVAPLPAPRPTTIPLSSGKGDPGDSDLAAGDDALEHGDLVGAQKSYQAARSVAGKREAATVGIDRVRVARAGVPLDYGAGKGNAEIAAAAADLARVVKAAPAFGAAFVELGRARLLLGDAPGAIDALERGTQLLPEEPEAHSQLGVGWLATGHADEATRELGRARDLDPGSGARRGNLGTALMMAGRTKEAIAQYEQRARIDDGDARAHSDLGTALLATDDLERSLSELGRAISLDPRRASFHSNLGYALQQAGRLDRAVTEYREAIRLDPKLAGAWINLATALARNPSTRPEARAALDRARSLSPDDPRVKANLEELDSLEKGRSPNAPGDAHPGSKFPVVP
jgi:Flp pilus assembly protein TadD